MSSTHCSSDRQTNEKAEAEPQVSGSGKKMTLLLNITFSLSGAYFVISDVEPDNTFNEGSRTNDILASGVMIPAV